MTNNLKLGIIGKGFVGSAVANGFDRKVDQFIVDPKYTNNTIADLIEFDPSVCFVCLPTPKQDTHSDVDISYVREALTQLDGYKGITVIKSTITPDHLTKLKKDFNLKLVYNPEFLTEANSFQDFLNPSMQILGGKWRDCESVEKAYVKHKVPWETFTEMLSQDKRIGDSHMKVPGTDGKLGYGGHCFPKDTEAFVYYSKLKKANLSILKETIKKNNTFREK